MLETLVPLLEECLEKMILRGLGGLAKSLLKVEPLRRYSAVH